MKGNSTKLVIALAIIAGAIGYLEYSKSAGTVNVLPGSADIPLLNASSTDLTAGQCTTEYCTTTASTKSAAELNTQNKEIAVKAGKYPRAKELVSPDGFINTQAFKISSLIGKKIIMVDFWTYSCINCQRTLPYMNAWYTKYKDAGLEIIGVETPEFAFEKDKANVQAAVDKYNIKYPVVQDNEHGTWNAYENLFWPHKYLIDQDGFIVYDHIGEGGYEDTEKEIQKLLQEKATREGKQLDFSGTVATEVAKTAVVGQYGISPETYFGAYRNGDFVDSGNAAPYQEGDANFVPPTPSEISPNHFYLGGWWNILKEYIENDRDDSSLTYKYTAMNVYLVAASKDGKPIDIDIYQDGVKIKTVTIQASTIYQLISNPKVESHTLEIRIPRAGLQAYTFTFG